MSFKTTILLSILAMVFSINGMAQSYDFRDNNGIPMKPKGPRPKSSCEEEQLVTYIYSAGVVYFNFSIPEGRAVLTVTRMEDGMSESAAFYTFSTFTYNVGTAPGSYLLEIKTSKNCYEGTLTLEY